MAWIFARRQLPPAPDVGEEAPPQVVQQPLGLLAVLRAHVPAGEGLDKGLVLAHPGHLEAHAVFFRGPREKHRFGRQSGHEDHAVGIQRDFVRGRGDEVIPGGGKLEVGLHRLVLPLEFEEGVADLPHGAEARTEALRLQRAHDKHAGNAAVVGGGPQRAGHGAQLQRRLAVAAQQAKVEDRRRVRDVRREVENQIGARLDLPAGRGLLPGSQRDEGPRRRRRTSRNAQPE